MGRNPASLKTVAKRLSGAMRVKKWCVGVAEELLPKEAADIVERFLRGAQDSDVRRENVNHAFP
jgi:hypothetical protein